MNIIDIIAIIPYFITLATVVAEEEDTLNLPKAPVSPQVRCTPSAYLCARAHTQTLICFSSFSLLSVSATGQVNESGYVLSNIAGDTISASVSNI